MPSFTLRCFPAAGLTGQYRLDVFQLVGQAEDRHALAQAGRRTKRYTKREQSGNKAAVERTLSSVRKPTNGVIW